MRFMKTLLFLGAVASLGFCGEVPKTLPEAFYSTAKSGKKMDLLLVDPSFEKAKGFSFDGQIAQVGERRDSALAEALAKNIGEIATKDSQAKLTLSIVEVTTKTFTGFGYIWGKATLEGVIKDPQGKILAAFKLKVKMSETMAGVKYHEVADEAVTAILKDLK